MSSSGSSGGGKVVYVGRLGSRTRERDLEDVFGKYGRLRRLDLKAGYAFLEYDDARDAEDAIRSMDGSDLDGSRIVVEPSHRGEGRCFSCGKEGHWARDCHERGSGGGRDGGGRDGGGRDGGRSRGCFVCGELGHFARDCRNGNSRGGGGRYSDRYHPYGRNRRSRSRSRSPRRRHSRSRSRSPRRRHSRSRSHSRSVSRSPRRRDSRSKSRSGSRSPSPKKVSRSRSGSRSPVKDNRSPSPRKGSSPRGSRDRSPSPKKDGSPLKNDAHSRDASPAGQTREPSPP